MSKKDAKKLKGPPGVQEIAVGEERAYVVPARVWEKIMAELEDYYDLCAYDDACEFEDDDDAFEHDELCVLLGRCPLCYLRNREGMTQEALAKKAGLSQSFIAKVEAGERELTAAAKKKIAKALGVPVEKLGGE